MNKKKLTLLWTLLIIFAFPNVSAFAQTSNLNVTSVPITQHNNVKANYINNTKDSDLYSVNIAWGAMEFTCTQSGMLTWDEDQHAFVDNTISDWTSTGNNITVTNHSNKRVKVNFEFKKDDSVTEDIQGSFDKPSDTLDSGVGYTYETADSFTSHLSLVGELSNDKTELIKVGVITVVINK